MNKTKYLGKFVKNIMNYVKTGIVDKQDSMRSIQTTEVRSMFRSAQNNTLPIRVRMLYDNEPKAEVACSLNMIDDNSDVILIDNGVSDDAGLVIWNSPEIVSELSPIDNFVVMYSMDNVAVSIPIDFPEDATNTEVEINNTSTSKGEVVKVTTDGTITDPKHTCNMVNDKCTICGKKNPVELEVLFMRSSSGRTYGSTTKAHEDLTTCNNETSEEFILTEDDILNGKYLYAACGLSTPGTTMSNTDLDQLNGLFNIYKYNETDEKWDYYNYNYNYIKKVHLYGGTNDGITAWLGSGITKHGNFGRVKSVKITEPGKYKLQVYFYATRSCSSSTAHRYFTYRAWMSMYGYPEENNDTEITME